ncbi:MAG: UDP-glucose/GDP-mannose dehydrogenase family protein [Candidatus Marinimicrobia bacterium]|nr:UDP-glucose/GDP-mannose dehydrogenase family protein [Candidatus Neomarinimicrobiota bacterium]
MKNICVVGTGYVGLVSGAGLADFGNNVVCVDIDKEKIAMLNNGKLPIYEPGLKELVDSNEKAGRLKFSTDIDEAIRNSEVVFSAVGTPPGEGGEADLRAVWAVATTFAKNLNNYKVFVNKSTVPVGTGKKTYDLIMKKKNSDIDFDVVSNPEFLREGSAVKDFLIPDRIVVGTTSEKSKEIMRDVYKSLYIRNNPFVLTNLESSELVKYASNAFLATKITFINEVANLCDAVGADVHVVANAMGMDGRISSKFLHPGPGYGGSCFPKDTLAYTEIFKEQGIQSKLVESVIEVNENQKALVVKKLQKFLPDLKGKTIAILGLAFKSNTDDTRESASKVVINKLQEAGAKVKVFDPIAMEDFKRDFPDLDYQEGIYETIEGVDALILMTEWNQFRNLDMQKVKEIMNRAIFIDTRNIYDADEMREIGFQFANSGRSQV